MVTSQVSQKGELNVKRTIRLTVSLLAALALAGFAFAQDDAEAEEPVVPETNEVAAASDIDVGALRRTAEALFNPIPLEVPDLEGNPYSDEKEVLGRSLWFDTRLSASWVISCNTCHNVGTAGVDLRTGSIGHGWQQGGRNSPTVLNAVFNIAQFWDGRAEDLAAQAMGPIQDSIEMNNTPERAVETLQSMPGYVDMFTAAFPEEDDPVTFENVALAIEVFEATLLTPNSRFDQFLRGDDSALDSQEIEGLHLFVTEGCVACHMGTNLGGHGYFPFGLAELPDADILPRDDIGRYGITNVESDRYAFKSPSLRNIELTPPYFHSGVIWDLEDAVRIMARAQLGSDLDDGDVTSITAFLRTLTGDQPEVTVPVLPAITAATPLPISMDD